MIRIYGAQKCQACKIIASRFVARGIEHEYHIASEHMTPVEGWRERNEHVFMAGMVHNDNELPIVTKDFNFYNFKEALELLDDLMRTEILAYAEEKGWTVDESILDNVEDNDYCCPCVTSHSVSCPCTKHEDMIEKNGYCRCMLFIDEGK